MMAAKAVCRTHAATERRVREIALAK